jgi:hypothetical protein
MALCEIIYQKRIKLRYILSATTVFGFVMLSRSEAPLWHPEAEILRCGSG